MWHAVYGISVGGGLVIAPPNEIKGLHRNNNPFKVMYMEQAILDMFYKARELI